MKKKFSIILVIMMCFCLLIGITYVKADSGWDSSYDGGSSWDSGSDWGSDYDYDYDYDSDWGYSSSSGGSGGSYGGSIMTVIIVIFVIVGIIYEIVKHTNKIRIVASDKLNDVGSSISKAYMYGEVTDDELIKLGVTREQFENMAFEIYKEIQVAWMNFDYKTLRKYTTDEIYNSYVMQLDALKLKKQKNVMRDFECVNVKIYNIKEVNGILNIDVYMNVKMYDYVESMKGSVLRGTDKKRIDIEYELTFVKSSKKKSKMTICPNCGAKVDMVTSGKCEYCGSVVVDSAKDYVMSRKTCIGQKMEK